jgi:hypothetical protein
MTADPAHDERDRIWRELEQLDYERAAVEQRTEPDTVRLEHLRLLRQRVAELRSRAERLLSREAF